MTPTISASRMASAMNGSEPSAANWDRVAPCEERDHGDRTRRELVRGPPERSDEHRQEGGVQPIVGRQPGELRVRHRLRDEHQRNAHAGEDIRTQQIARQRKPGEKGQVAAQPVHVVSLLCVKAPV